MIITTVHHKRGFTLVELIISMGVIAVLSTLITMSFIHITRVLKEVEVKRQLAQYTANIISTLSMDIEDLYLVPANSNDQYLELTSGDTTKKISYKILPSQNANSQSTEHTLERTEITGNNATSGEFLSNEFTITDMKFHYLSSNSIKCDTPPLIQITLTTGRKSIDSFQPTTTINTMFSTGNNPILYHQYCTSLPPTP